MQCSLAHGVLHKAVQGARRFRAHGGSAHGGSAKGGSTQGSLAYSVQCTAVRRKAVRHMVFGAELFYKGHLRKIDFEEE